MNHLDPSSFSLRLSNQNCHQFQLSRFRVRVAGKTHSKQRYWECGMFVNSTTHWLKCCWSRCHLKIAFKGWRRWWLCSHKMKHSPSPPLACKSLLWLSCNLFSYADTHLSQMWPHRWGPTSKHHTTAFLVFETSLSNHRRNSKQQQTASKLCLYLSHWGLHSADLEKKLSV